MAIKRKDIIYVLTRVDVEDCAKEIGIKKLTELLLPEGTEILREFRRGWYVWSLAEEEEEVS